MGSTENDGIEREFPRREKQVGSADPRETSRIYRFVDLETDASADASRRVRVAPTTLGSRRKARRDFTISTMTITAIRRHGVRACATIVRHDRARSARSLRSAALLVSG